MEADEFDHRADRTEGPLELDLHRKATVIDGLVTANWRRRVFEDMHCGGLTAATCTCCVWEGFRGAMDNAAQWKAWFDQ